MTPIVIGNQEFYSIEEMIAKADLENIIVRDTETGEVVNTYEYIWKLLQKSMIKHELFGDDDEYCLDEFNYQESDEKD